MNTARLSTRAHFRDPIRPRQPAGSAGRPVELQSSSCVSVTPRLRVDPRSPQSPL